MTTSNYEVNCEYCSKLDISASLYYAVVFSDDCTREHSENNHIVKMLIKYNGVAYQRGNTEGTSKLEHTYTISTKGKYRTIKDLWYCISYKGHNTASRL